MGGISVVALVWFCSRLQRLSSDSIIKFAPHILDVSDQKNFFTSTCRTGRALVQSIPVVRVGGKEGDRCNMYTKWQQWVCGVKAHSLAGRTLIGKTGVHSCVMRRRRLGGRQRPAPPQPTPFPTSPSTASSLMVVQDI